MNIFLPYEHNIIESVSVLDDIRLNKQILEIYQLLMNAEAEKNGHDIKGYKNHPVYVFYKNNIKFLAYYGAIACIEYSYRFGKKHRLRHEFINSYFYGVDFNVPILSQPTYTPYYMEGSKGQPNYIRTTDNVSALFQQKLINKWNNDKAKGRPPKWTNRQVPEFYKKEILNEK